MTTLKEAAQRVLKAGGDWLGDMTEKAAEDPWANEFMSAMEAMAAIVNNEPEGRMNLEAILDIDNCVEEAEEALDAHWTELESVVNETILKDIETATNALQSIGFIILRAVGGSDKLARLRGGGE